MSRYRTLKKMLWRHTVRKLFPVRRELPRSIDPRSNQPPLPLPMGFTQDAILDALTVASIDGSAIGELRCYASHDNERFLRTLELIPPAIETVLEIGASPYFTTLLMRWFRPELKLTLINWFGRIEEDAQQAVSTKNPAGHNFSEVMPFHTVNVETMTLPFADTSFDCVLYCEVI